MYICFSKMSVLICICTVSLLLWSLCCPVALAKCLFCVWIFVFLLLGVCWKIHDNIVSVFEPFVVSLFLLPVLINLQGALLLKDPPGILPHWTVSHNYKSCCLSYICFLDSIQRVKLTNRRMYYSYKKTKIHISNIFHSIITTHAITQTAIQHNDVSLI